MSGSCDGFSDVMKRLVVRETVNVVSLGEPVNFSTLVLQRTSIDAVVIPVYKFSDLLAIM